MSESLLGMLSVQEQLLLDVSHELRSPMTRMKVALEFIPKNSCGEVYSSMRRKWSMVTEILETARLKSELSQLNREKRIWSN